MRKILTLFILVVLLFLGAIPGSFAKGGSTPPSPFVPCGDGTALCWTILGTGIDLRDDGTGNFQFRENGGAWGDFDTSSGTSLTAANLATLVSGLSSGAIDVNSVVYVVIGGVSYKTTLDDVLGLIADGHIPSGITRDTEVMTIVLANDGSGSGLDADTVDGAEPSVFVPANEADPGVATHEAAADPHTGYMLESAIVTTVGDPGADTSYPSEQAVREALNLKVNLALWNANTVLAATSDDTPAPITLAEQTVLGRITSGNIAALTLGVAAGNVAQWPADPAAHTLFGFDNTTNTYKVILIGSGLSFDQPTGTLSATGAGSGDVSGPASSTDNALPRFDSTTGKIIQNSGVTVDDNDIMSFPAGGYINIPGTANGPQYGFDLEDTDNGSNYSGWGSPASVTTDYIALRPAAPPGSANSVMAFNTGAALTFSDNTSKTALAGTWVDLDDYLLVANTPTKATLGLDTTDSPQFAGVNIGHASDTTVTRVSAGRIAVEGVNVPTISSTDSLTNKTLTGSGNVIPVTYSVACSDETTDLTTGSAKRTFRIPFAMTVTAVRASVNTAPVGSTLNVDINEGGASILSTVITIDASEETSTTAATPAVISDSSLADDAEITIDIDQIGSSTAGKGLKVVLIGTRTM